MSGADGAVPVVTIQCDWNDVIRLPKGDAWISFKYLHQSGVHEKLSTSANTADGKIKVNLPETYQYISHSNFSLILKHVKSGLKIAFVAPTKAHKVHDKGVLSVGASENALAASSCEGDKFLVWDSRTGEIHLTLRGHGGPVYKSRFFPSGIVVLSAGADGSVRVWSAEDGINPVTLIGHKMSISDISIVERGRNVISVSKDGSAKLWDVGEKRCLDNIIEGVGPINACCITTTTDVFEVQNEREVGTGNKLLVMGCESGEIICAHVAKREEVFRIQLSSACNACVVVDQFIIAGCNNGTIYQLSLQDGSEIKRWEESANPVFSMAALLNKTFIVGRQDGTCTVLSTQEAYRNSRVQLTGSDCDGIRDIAFNGKWIFTACRDTIIRKYDYNQVAVHFK